jgi:hypothetical protein
MSEPNDFEGKSENERLVAEFLSWPVADAEEPDPARDAAFALEHERKIREARTLTADEVAQIKAIGSMGILSQELGGRWGWEANMDDHWVGLYSNRHKHILRAHHALREAGWTVSIEHDPYDPGWNHRVWVTEFVKIHGINYWSWK